MAAVDQYPSSAAPAPAAAVAAPEAVAPPPGNPRFPLFDGLRAIAALSVLVYHSAFMAGASLGPAVPSRLLDQLNVGVAVFFVISGFLMYRPLLAARAALGPPVRIRDYARRRVLRIVPGYWVALTVLAIFPGLPDMFSGHWWVYYGFLQDYDGPRALDGIGVAWTLGCEVVFYAMLPFLSIAFDRVARTRGRRVWWPFELAALAGLCVTSAIYRALVNGHVTRITGNSFVGTFAWFGLGMMLALASVTLAADPGVRLRAVRRYSALGWPLAIVAYVYLSLGLPYTNGNPFLARPDDAYVVAWYALSGIVAACLVVPAVFAVGSQTAVARLLAWRPLAWLGLISYGIYLYHNPLLLWISNGQVGSVHPALRLAWLTLVTVAAGVLAAALSYYLVERPFLRLKERPRLLRVGVIQGFRRQA